jgi:hypothetical protein
MKMLEDVTENNNLVNNNKLRGNETRVIQDV